MQVFGIATILTIFPKTLAPKGYAMQNSLNKRRQRMIRIENLSFQYANVTAIHDLSVNIEAGERVAFIGPSGAGKSTLLKCLSASVSVKKGQLSVEGFDACTENTKYRRRIGWLASDEHYWPELTPRLTLEAISQFRRMPRSRLASKLKLWDDAFQIGSFWDKPIAALSHGQQRKLSLCRLLLLEAPYTLLDDPTEALDPIDAKSLLEILKSWPEPLVILMATHQEAWVTSIAKRVIALKQGAICADLSVADALAQAPDHRDIALAFKPSMTTEDVEEAINLLHTLPQVKAIIHHPDSMELLIRSHSSQDVYPALRELLISTDWPLSYLKQFTGSLNYLYRDADIPA